MNNATKIRNFDEIKLEKEKKLCAFVVSVLLNGEKEQRQYKN